MYIAPDTPKTKNGHVSSPKHPERKKTSKAGSRRPQTPLSAINTLESYLVPNISTNEERGVAAEEKDTESPLELDERNRFVTTETGLLSPGVANALFSDPNPSLSDELKADSEEENNVIDNLRKRKKSEEDSDEKRRPRKKDQATDGVWNFLQRTANGIKTTLFTESSEDWDECVERETPIAEAVPVSTIAWDQTPTQERRENPPVRAGEAEKSQDEKELDKHDEDDVDLVDLNDTDLLDGLRSKGGIVNATKENKDTTNDRDRELLPEREIETNPITS